VTLSYRTREVVDFAVWTGRGAGWGAVVRFDLLKILMVDDNHHMRTLIGEILRAIGVNHLYEAADGAAALEVLRREDIDIVLTDLAMQPLDGIDFCRLVRNAPDSPNPMIPIIMITGHSTMRRIGEARDVGANEFLAKPITARGIIHRITEIVEHPRSFIRTQDYFGPDRRRRVDPHYRGPKRREGEAALEL
jgi:two-component system, chemotaxis family, chemotaxis protein CheY